MCINGASVWHEATYPPNKSCPLIPAVPTVQLWRVAHCPGSAWPVDSWCPCWRCATGHHWLCDLKSKQAHVKPQRAAQKQFCGACFPAAILWCIVRAWHSEWSTHHSLFMRICSGLCAALLFLSPTRPSKPQISSQRCSCEPLHVLLPVLPSRWS